MHVDNLMAEIILTIEHEAGLHARPASLFVQTANRFLSDISISCNGKCVNAKSILSVLTLGVHRNAMIKIQAQGEDADQAVSALKSLIERNFEV
jgi:phosphotransferase system HPr (HPr) family protein